MASGVFGDVGFDDGGGTSGDELGIDGDVGEVGVCCAQPAAIALSAMTARVDLVAFILHSSIREKNFCRLSADADARADSDRLNLLQVSFHCR